MFGRLLSTGQDHDTELLLVSVACEFNLDLALSLSDILELLSFLLGQVIESRGTV
jgi:hypothetical protein